MRAHRPLLEPCGRFVVVRSLPSQPSMGDGLAEVDALDARAVPTRVLLAVVVLPDDARAVEQIDEGVPVRCRRGCRLIDTAGPVDLLQALEVVEQLTTDRAPRPPPAGDHQRGADTVAAGSAAEAFDAFQRGRPDVMVVDIAMPGEDGYALMKRLRESSPDRKLPPALALTGFASLSDRTAAHEAGFRMHLAKPAEPASVAWTIADLVSTKEDTN